KMMKQTRCYCCDKPIEPEWLPVGEFIVCDECSSDTDKLSVEKLEPIGYYNGAHGFLHDEFDKDCYCQGGCSMEAVYTESQVKKLTGENKVEKLQHQLTIPKSIADELEKYDFELTSKGLMYRNMGGTLVEFSRV
ncbi:hypothetical protein EFK39_10435, partial [Lactococcus lactis subsp. lactis]|nr:hypothetical protein [Lactococcus lactis subsp. lactis]